MSPHRYTEREAQIGRALPSARIQLEAVAFEASLALFMKNGWNRAEESSPYMSNWHIDCIADHLTAAADRQIKGPLIFTMPPRHMKSKGINVFFPAWVWAQEVPEGLTQKGIYVRPNAWRGPGVTFAFISYDQDLSNRDSRACMTLIQSTWYQQRWRDRFKLNREKVEEFNNGHGGKRQALSFSGKLTGFGAHLIFIDDAHNIMSDSYEVERIKVLDGWDNALKSRLDDKINGMFIIAMQRSNENDLVGHILAREFDGLHVCLPYEFERKHPFAFVDPPQKVIRVTDSSDGTGGGPPVGQLWEDTRKDGDVLWPQRFPREVMKKDIEGMSSHQCTPYESPILMADLSIKPIGEIKVGDQIVGFSKKQRKDGVNGRQRLIKTEVLEIHRYVAPVVKMTLDSGEAIRCTRNHKWYSGKLRSSRSPYVSVVLGKKTKLCRICPSRLPELSIDDVRMAGWLGGFFDGEGTVSLSYKKWNEVADYKPSASIYFYQGSGRNAPLCEKLEQHLKHFGFEYTFYEDERKENKSAACYGYRQYRLLGRNLEDYQRFLHIVQPTKWRDRIIGAAYGANFVQRKDLVTSIEDDGVEEVFALTTTTGNYVVWGLASSNSAGQYQQRPTAREGGIFKRHWFDNPVKFAPTNLQLVRSWDLASSVEAKYDPDYTVGVLMGRSATTGMIYILDVIRGRYSPAERENKLRATAILDGKHCRIRIPQDPAGAGKFEAHYNVGLLQGFVVWTEREKGSKDIRAESFAAQCEHSFVKLVEGAWNDAFIDEMCAFPNGNHDDQVDAACAAFRALTRRVTITAISA